MKHLLLTILSFFAAFSFAQNANWGTGLPITATINGTSISVSVYDPILGSNQTSSLSVGSNPIFQNVDGVVVAYGDLDYMRYTTYDVEQHTWKGGVQNIGANAIIMTQDGVVVGYGDADYMRFETYDVEQHAWKGGVQNIGANAIIMTQDGVVVGYGDADYMRFETYDVEQHAWKGGVQNIGANGIIMTQDGVVVGYGDVDYMRFETYDIEEHTWKGGAQNIGANGIIITHDGVVVGFGDGDYLRYTIYDIDNHVWNGSSKSLGASGSFTLSAGTISYTGSTSGITGYNVNSHSWGSSPTGIACKFLPISFTNSAWVYMQCMTMGASSYTYNCGDGHQISRRQSWKKYNNSNTYNADLNVSNGNNNSTCNATINVVNAIEAPSKMTFSVLPNPTSDILTISSKDYLENDLTVFIYDSQGKKVYQQIDILPFSVKNWTSGLYFLQVFSAKKGLIFSQKWIKE